MGTSSEFGSGTCLRSSTSTGSRSRPAAGDLTVAVAFGGAFYATLAADAVGLDVEPGSLPSLIQLGREIKHAVESQHEIVHPDEPELRDVYGVIFFADHGGEPLVQRNVTVFADGEVDRSPCGSGTSARLAVLHREGRLAVGDSLLHRSIVGTEFEGRIVEETLVAGRPAVVTEVAGSAHLTGRHEFVLSPTTCSARVSSCDDQRGPRPLRELQTHDVSIATWMSWARLRGDRSAPAPRLDTHSPPGA